MSLCLVLTADRTLALHLAIALDLHERACRANGTHFSEEITTLRKQAWRVAK